MNDHRNALLRKLPKIDELILYLEKRGELNQRRSYRPVTQHGLLLAGVRRQWQRDHQRQ